MGKTEQIVSLEARRQGQRTLRKIAVDPDAAEFQPDPLVIEERRFPLAGRSTVYVIALLIVSAAAWATFSKIERTVVAQGKLITTAALLVVQPLETAMVRTIDVDVGDEVKAGQILATLDPTFTESSETANREKIDLLSAEADRLTAEVNGREYLPGNGIQDERSPTALQRKIYLHRAAELQAMKAGADAEAANLEAQLVTNRVSQMDMQGRLKILMEVEKVRDQLYSSSLGSLLALLQSRAERLGLEEMLNQKTNQEQELIHRLAASRENKEKTINGWLREAEDKLSQIRKEIVTSQQQLIVAERKNKLIVLRAPADGVVLTVGQRSIGSVAKEAETLFTLVPRESDIEAEVEIESADIGRLRVGDPVRIKLEALPYQRYGTIDGNVRVISANSFEPDKSEFRSNKGELGPRFFRARIALGAWQLRDLPPDFRLIPGMTGTAEIIVGKRTIISYLLNPIVRTFDEGLREP